MLYSSNPASLSLTSKDKKEVYNESFCVCIDEEGGRVCTKMYDSEFTGREHQEF